MQRFAHDLHGELESKVELRTLSWGGSNLMLFLVLPYFFIRSFFMLLTGKIDIIHAQDGVVSILLTPLAWVFKRPMVVVIHGLDVTYKLWLFQWLIRWSLISATEVICISSAAKSEVTARGISEDRVTVIPLGVTDDIFTNDKLAARETLDKEYPELQNKQVLLSSGRLVKRKGMEWFIRNVLPVITESEPSTTLVISGEGEARSAIEAAVTETKMQDSVLLLGRTSDELLHNLYNAADCFVMPNIVVPGDMEGFGRVLVEAALCEVPVVTSGIEGIVDAIHSGKNGVLVPTEDIPAHAQAILRVLRDTEASQKQGKHAREYSLKTFGWGEIVKQYLQVYKQTEKSRA